MSAQFLVYFRGQPVRFKHHQARRVYEIVPRSMASIFISEADAWFAAMQYQLRPDFTEVKSISELQPS